MHSFSVSKSPSVTSTGTTTSEDSQPGTRDEQRPQSAFVGLSTTIHTPESALIAATYHQQDQVELLPEEIGTTQISPLEALATYLAVTFDDDHQGQSASSLSLSNEPSRSQRSSQPVDDVVPIVKEEPSPDPTDKWTILRGGKKRPFKCGYQGCGRTYVKKASLQTHFVTHIGDSELRCYLGDCTGIVTYPNTQTLTRHIKVHHTFERPFGCKLCDRRFRRQDYLKRHMERVHSPRVEKKLPKPQSVTKSSSAKTSTNTASTSTMTSRVSQSASAAGQRQQGSFVDLSTTVRMPEPTLIPATYYQQDEPGLLSGINVSGISSSQANPFEILATHQTVTFEDQIQEQLDEFPLPFDVLLQPLNDFDLMASEDPDDVNLSILPNKNDERISNRTTISTPEHEILPPNNDHLWQALTGIVPEAPLVGIKGGPKLPSSQHLAKQRPDPTDTNKWIIVDKSQERPYRCGYPGGCDMSYKIKHLLTRHFIAHTGVSNFGCTYPECVGKKYFRDQAKLKRHIISKHTLEKPFRCDRCNKRFTRKEGLKYHREHVHSPENEKKSQKRKK